MFVLSDHLLISNSIPITEGQTSNLLIHRDGLGAYEKSSRKMRESLDSSVTVRVAIP
jgi:hypothetical protein